MPHFTLVTLGAYLIFLATTLVPEQDTRPADLLVRGGTVVTMNAQGQILEDGAVVIGGDRILAVGPAAELTARFKAARTLDATGKIVMPGLINTHTHAPMTLFRGIADDLALMDWLRNFIFPAEAKNVDEEFVRWGTRLGCLEMIRGGTTTYVDMYYFEDAIAEETAKAGMRAILGETVLDFPAPDNKTWVDAVAYTEKFLRKWQGHVLITPAVAPHAPYTVSPDHLKEAHALARNHDAPLLIHLAETETEVKQVRDKHGVSPVAYLDQLGILDRRLIAAHLVWPTTEDLVTLARRGVGVGHCPQSNMKLASGTSPVPALLRAGVAVGLGTDGAASNNDLSLWEEMDTAAKLHKLISKDPTVLSAREALEMATLGGARAIHKEKEIGSLEAGKRADVIVVRLDRAHQTPLYNVYSHLVYATKATDVDSVIINGKEVMRDRQVLTLDAAAVLAKARQYRDRIRQSISK